MWGVFGPKRDLTVREERRLRVFENRVLWGVFGPKRDLTVREERRLRVLEYGVVESIWA